MAITEIKVEAPAIDARLFDHDPAPLPPCISKDECTARYIGSLKAWGEALADKLDRIKAQWK